jgi:adenine-specific DNA methylase
MVIASRNPVHSVLFLILAFVNAAGLFVLLGAEFLAMILIIVYVASAFASLPYTFDQRLKHVRRPEECDEHELLAGIWPEVNRHFGTNALSMTDLIEELGIARFGHRTRLADTFCGGGSIPFEAARMGCDVYASDLNHLDDR